MKYLRRVLQIYVLITNPSSKYIPCMQPVAVVVAVATTKIYTSMGCGQGAVAMQLLE